MTICHINDDDDDDILTLTQHHISVKACAVFPLFYSRLLMLMS